MTIEQYIKNVKEFASKNQDAKELVFNCLTRKK